MDMCRLRDRGVLQQPCDNDRTMTWIRSPCWDGFWFLSAPVLGLLLVFFPPLISLFLILNIAHAVSPIILAWSHRQYRPVMLKRPGKFVGVPVVLFALALVMACLSVRFFPHYNPAHQYALETLSFATVQVPIVVWATLYAVWDLYHGGAQNFGIWCLYRRRSVQGWQKWAILLTFVLFQVIISHAVPEWSRNRTIFLFIFGLIAFNHSLAAIGLCAHVHGRHWGVSPCYFAGAMLLLGFVGSFALLFGLRHSLFVATFAVALRASLGIWHFLQDRWIWRMSDPQVRAAIGKELFGARAIGP
jgi:hypothetical protein